MPIVVCGFCPVSLTVFGFRRNRVFGYVIWWGVLFPVSLRKMCSSTIRVCLILLAIFGFDLNSFWFCGFLLLFVRFCGFLYTPMPSTLNIIRPRDFELGQLELYSSSHWFCFHLRKFTSKTESNSLGLFKTQTGKLQCLNLKYFFRTMWYQERFLWKP